MLEHRLPGGRIGHEWLDSGPEGDPVLRVRVDDRELDRLRRACQLSQFQYDAGNKLRDLWEQAGIRSAVHAMNHNSFVGVFEGPRGEVSDADAFALFQQYIQAPHIRCRGVVYAVCVQDLGVKAYADRCGQHVTSALQDLQRGLGRLANVMSRE